MWFLKFIFLWIIVTVFIDLYFYPNSIGKKNSYTNELINFLCTFLEIKKYNMSLEVGFTEWDVALI